MPTAKKQERCSPVSVPVLGPTLLGEDADGAIDETAEPDGVGSTEPDEPVTESDWVGDTTDDGVELGAEGIEVPVGVGEMLVMGSEGEGALDGEEIAVLVLAEADEREETSEPDWGAAMTAAAEMRAKRAESDGDSFILSSNFSNELEGVKARN